MPQAMQRLIEQYIFEIKKIYGSHLRKVILYGSYARGDFKPDSDMDIMILADIQPEEISNLADRIYDITYDFEVKYEMEINPSIQSIQVYEQWKGVYPFFMNIEKDGVAV